VLFDLPLDVTTQATPVTLMRQELHVHDASAAPGPKPRPWISLRWRLWLLRIDSDPTRSTVSVGMGRCSLRAGGGSHADRPTRTAQGTG